MCAGPCRNWCSMKNSASRSLHDAALLASFVALLLAGGLRSANSADETAKLVKTTDGQIPADTSSKASGRCGTTKDADGWWFVTPGGKRFFSLGVCMLNQGAKPGEFDPAKPSYAALRHYDEPRAWADSSLRRLKEWGFT